MSKPHLQVNDPAAWADEVLPDRRDLALLAVERTRMPMMVSDPRQPDDPIVLANQAFLDLIGYPADEVIGRNCRFLQGPDTDPAAVQAIRDCLGAGGDCNVELLNYRKDGSAFWNALHISPLRADGGRILYHFASQHDITRVRAAADIEASEIALLREVDHRAKNALALVQGIVRLSRADDAPAYARAVQGRVDALATAHGLLAEHRWRAVPLDSLVAAMIRGMGVERVAADGPPVGIAPGQVQPLALLLHELLDNALRHGGLSVPEGRLAIEWQPHDGQLAIRLHESGGPPPPPEHVAGFGHKVINAVTARQLGGAVSFDWRPEGLCSELIIPCELSA